MLRWEFYCSLAHVISVLVVRIWFQFAFPGATEWRTRGSTICCGNVPSYKHSLLRGVHRFINSISYMIVLCTRPFVWSNLLANLKDKICWNISYESLKLKFIDWKLNFLRTVACTFVAVCWGSKDVWLQHFFCWWATSNYVTIKTIFRTFSF